ncbi:MAG: hypothetical protein BWY99_02794 [Synergistetes bacterium ADurb.BinA166]|nr:MAG: hypothetical protein BWY99_02794 [Synergistetes bacterium ADurb.BinA166]
MSFPRSTATVYWMRSFVPMLKKSDSFAKWSESTAVEGTSTIMPARTPSSNGIFR